MRSRAFATSGAQPDSTAIDGKTQLGIRGYLYW